MRKLILQMQLSLDGFAAGPNGEGDWVVLAGKPDPAALQFTLDLADRCDTILLGRKSIPGFVPYWEDLADHQPDSPWYPIAQRMVNMRKIAFSHSETALPGRNLEVENGDLVTAVQALKAQAGKDLLVYGGVGFVRSLIEHNLIDVYYLVINPVALGSGQSIFTKRKVLVLQSTTVYSNGKVLHKYIPV